MKKISLLIIALFTFFSFKLIPHAIVAIDGKELTDNNYVTKAAGNKVVGFYNSGHDDLSNWKNYYLITFCADPDDQIVNWYSSGSIPVSTLNIYDTDFKCMYPNSTYSGGHIVYMYGTLSPLNCGSDNKCLYHGSFTFYSSSGSWSLLSLSYSDTVIDIDYSNNTIISQNKEIVEQNKQIIAGNTQINNSINSMKTQLTDKLQGIIGSNKVTQDKIDETNDKLDKVDDTLNNDDIDTSGASSFFDDFDDTDHEGISGVITSPLRFVNKLTGTCNPISFTAFDEEIILPCGTTLFWDKPEVNSFKTVWNILVGGPIVYGLFVLLFNVIHRMKNPDDDRIEVMKL